MWQGAGYAETLDPERARIIQTLASRVAPQARSLLQLSCVKELSTHDHDWQLVWCQVKLSSGLHGNPSCKDSPLPPGSGDSSCMA